MTHKAYLYEKKHIPFLKMNLIFSENHLFLSLE